MNETPTKEISDRSHKRVKARDGATLILRPLVVEDWENLVAAFPKMDPRDVRTRLFVAREAASERFARAFCTIKREKGDECLVLVPEDAQGDLLGGVRLMADPGGRSGEFAVTVRSDQQGRGLGAILMNALVDIGREKGYDMIWGSILPGNRGMLHLARKVGFDVRRDPEDFRQMHAVLTLEREPN